MRFLPLQQHFTATLVWQVQYTYCTWQGSLMTVEHSYDCNLTQNRSIANKNTTAAIFPWKLSPSPFQSLMRWRDRTGEGISLLISSALRPLAPLNVTGLHFASRAPGFHLSSCCTNPHLALFALKTEAALVRSHLGAALLAGSSAYSKLKEDGENAIH